MARPNCWRSLAYEQARSRADCARPVAAAAIPRRPASRARQGDGHALPLGADAVRGVDAHVVVHHLAHGVAVQAHLAFRGAERQPGCVGRDDEAGQALAAVVGGAREGRVVVGVAGVADPGLAAAQHVGGRVAVAAALTDRAGRHRADVAAGLLLGQAVGAELLAREHAGEQGLLLGLGRERRHRVGRERVHRDPDGHAHPRRRDLLDDLEVDLVGLAVAAELLGVGEREQARGAQGAEDLGGEGLVGGGGPFGVVDPGAQFLVADLAGQVDEVLTLLGRHQPRRCHGPTIPSAPRGQAG